MNSVLLIFLITVLPVHNLSAQTNDSINRKRLTGVILTESTLFAGTMFGLYQLWYKDYPQSNFHFINDWNGWMQMDKIGHAVTSYYVGKIGFETLRWCGVSEKHSVIYGGSLGFIYLLTIESLDGFSAEWGASPSDLVFNAGGAALFIGQQLAWKKQRITLKFSYHYTKYPDYRPDLFGYDLLQQLVKDYNGHTYWLSTNIKSFSKRDSWVPDWLNLAVGYGADGMLGAASNPDEYNGRPLPHFDRYRRFFLSLDVDFSRIKTNSNFLKIIFSALGFIKVPFPTLEYNSLGQVKFHPLYF